MVLKDKALYCYRDPDDEKAESYIGLPGMITTVRVPYLLYALQGNTFPSTYNARVLVVSVDN